MLSPLSIHFYYAKIKLFILLFIDLFCGVQQQSE